MVDLLKKLGVEPDGIIGHSVGEIACGYADGCLSARDAILIAYWRGHSVKLANITDGAMAAVGMCKNSLLRTFLREHAVKLVNITDGAAVGMF